MTFDPASGAASLPGTIVWIAPFYNRTGYGIVARSWVTALHRAGARIRVVAVDDAQPGVDDCDLDLIKRLESTLVVPPVTAIISHLPQPKWASLALPEPSVRIITTTFEGDAPPPGWIDWCNRLDQVWLNQEADRARWVAAGLDPARIEVFPWPNLWQDEPRVPVPPLDPPGPGRRFRFLSNATFSPRRRWDVLLRAYFEEFGDEDQVELYLKTLYPPWHPVPGQPRRDLHDLIESLRRATGSTARVVVDEELGTRTDLMRLVDRCDAYVSTDVLPTAPVGEAFLRHKPAIVTDEALGLVPLDGVLVVPTDPGARVEMTPGMLAYLPHHRGRSWPRLEVAPLRAALRRMYGLSPEERRAMGDRAAAYCAARSGAEVVVPRTVEAIRRAWERRSATPPAASTSPPTVVWEGSQLVHHSLALVNRELCLRLIDLGHEVSLIPYEPDQFGPEADPRFAKLVERVRAPLSRPADVHVRHQWPPCLTPPPSGRWVMIQPWEFGSVPTAWIGPMRDLVDEVWVPSHYLRDCYVRSGLPAEQVAVVPNGVDVARFHPDTPPLGLKTRKKTRLLFVGGTIWRKGIDVLLEAYARAFTSWDDVCLVIKDLGGQSFYRGQTAQDSIARLRADPAAPEVEYLDRVLNADELAGLYTACDCLVHPYRGEGFGLPIAEAMACGRPVVVTGFGAARDFCDESNAYLVPFQLLRNAEKRVDDLETVDNPFWAEPDPAALVEILRRVVANPDEAKAKGEAGLTRIRSAFTWDHAARTAAERLQALCDRPIRRFAGDRAHPTPALPARGEGVAGPPSGGSTDFPPRAGGREEGRNAELRRAAEEAEARSDKAAALTAYREAAKLDPAEPSLAYAAGRLAFLAGDYPTASQWLKRAIAQDPGRAEARVTLGRCYQAQGRSDLALNQYRAALNLEPGNEEAAGLLAMVQ